MPQARQWFKSSGRRPAAKRQAGDSGAGGRREVRRGNIGTGKTGGSGQRQRRQHQARRSAQVTAQASGPRIAVDGITAGVGRNRVDTANAAQLAGLDILGQHGHRRPQRRQHGQESQPGGKAFPYRECQSELGVVEHGGIIGCRVLRRRARSSSSSSSFLFLVLLAGSRPGGRGTFGETRKAGFLCSPKARYARGVCSLRAAKLRKHQKYPKERRPAVWVPPLRCGQPALLDCGGGLAKLATLRFAQTTPALIPPPSALLGPARTGQAGAGTEDKYQGKKSVQTRTRHGVSLWFLGIGIFLPPLVDAPRSGGSGGSGIALFERSEFSETPPEPSTAGCP